MYDDDLMLKFNALMIIIINPSGIIVDENNKVWRN